MKTRLLFFVSLFSGFFWANLVRAVCPVCVVAIGAGLGLSRWLGVDDTISSTWIGGLMVAIILWTINWFKKKGWRFAYRAVYITLAYYILVYVPLYYYGIVGYPANTIWGIDKIIFGTVVGSVAFLAGDWFSNYLKKKNNGKVLFYYQKVIIPLVILLLISLILWQIV